MHLGTKTQSVTVAVWLSGIRGRVEVPHTLFLHLGILLSLFLPDAEHCPQTQPDDYVK